jgi:aromatic-L-amino-acid decarboxylase
MWTRRPGAFHEAFALVPEYLAATPDAVDIKDYGPALGRRFRALKLWFVLRWFGLEGLRQRIRNHLELAESFAGWVDAAPDWERLAPVPFSTVCFRHVPPALAGDEAALDIHNAAVMEAVNRSGDAFLSHTKLRGRFTIRLAIGNLRTERRHVERAWELLRQAATAEESTR